MEDLREKVYECTLAVEAHMICDLLARAGISARVDGEFLAGAGGELPIGSAIKVRVDPTRADEAREVIDEWERMQPSEPLPPQPRSRMHSPLWFLFGMLVGGGAIYLAFIGPATAEVDDLDGDGDADVTYHYEGGTLRRAEYDRNGDDKTDLRWLYDRRGLALRYESDDDFDGRFERLGAAKNGWIVTTTLDSNGDGRPDRIEHSRNEVVESADILDDQGRRVVVRESFKGGWRMSSEFDEDGDGVFERRIEYDRFGKAK